MLSGSPDVIVYGETLESPMLSMDMEAAKRHSISYYAGRCMLRSPLPNYLLSSAPLPSRQLEARSHKHS